MSFADRESLRHRYPHGPYSMPDPVEVTGAQPGDKIEVCITAPRRRLLAHRPVHRRVGGGTR